MQKSPADDFSVGRGCDFVPPRLFSEGLDPVGDFLLRDGGGEALALLPVAGAGERRELRAALADVAAAGGAEGDDRLAGEVIGLDERVHRPRGDAPPDRIVKCSPSSPALENTGLNCLHKCVFCSFLIAYCSDLSHLLYSGSPVYTNTYV